MANSKSNKKPDKLCVVGWTDYDDQYFPDCDDKKAFDAVVKEVREKQYLFGGDSHQDYSDCCPVLSDGTKFCTSWRGWGAVIAEAYDQRGANGKRDHMAGYMDMMINPEAIRRPPEGVDFSRINTVKRYTRLRMPPAHDYYEYLNFHACPLTDKIKKIQPYDYIYLDYKDDPKRPLYETVKVLAVLTGETYEEVIAQAEQRFYFQSSLFGFDDNLTNEQIAEKVRIDYPEGEEIGAACIVFEYARDDDGLTGEWVKID